MVNELLLFLWGAAIAANENLIWSDFQINERTPQHLFWSGHFQSIDGQAWNTSDYYRPKDPSLEVILSAYSPISNNTILTTSFSYHTETSALAILVPSALSFSINADYATDTYGYWSLGFSNLFQSSSSNVDYPCSDDFGRQYHCGSAIPFSEKAQFKTIRSFDTIFSISRTWIF